jgi:hypothetical protein
MKRPHQKKALSQYLHASHSPTRTYVSIISPATTDTLIKVNTNKDSRKGKGVGWITILKYFNESERERESRLKSYRMEEVPETRGSCIITIAHQFSNCTDVYENVTGLCSQYCLARSWPGVKCGGIFMAPFNMHANVNVDMF